MLVLRSTTPQPLQPGHVSVPRCSGLRLSPSIHPNSQRRRPDHHHLLYSYSYTAACHTCSGPFDGHELVHLRIFTIYLPQISATCIPVSDHCSDDVPWPSNFCSSGPTSPHEPYEKLNFFLRAFPQPPAYSPLGKSILASASHTN